METRAAEFDSFFVEQIAACDRCKQQLLADGRGDEATFQQVKANIFGIFRTVFSVAVKTCVDDPAAVEIFFAQRIDQIPNDWAAAYEKAQAHNDTGRMHLEQLKLDTVRQIRERFAAIWEGAQ